MDKFTPNQEQKQIINHINGAILVLAPVGTGKTSVLSARVMKALENGIPANKILCLTFTNRAALEMSERLTKICPDDVKHITIKTFHSLCTIMLRTEARNIGLPVDFIVYDDADCQEIIKQLFPIEKKGEEQRILGDIAACKTVKCSHNSFSKTSDFNIFDTLSSQKAKLCEQYQQILQQRHALDFADLVFYVSSMFASYPEIRKKWQNTFDFIQVDEVQDTHLSEYEITKILANKTGNLAMIGDLDQTIYEWRGSEPLQVIKQFKKDFDVQGYSLTYNYRATKKLLNAASNFAQCLKQRYTKVIPSPDCETGDIIQLHKADNEYSEARWISLNIKKMAHKYPDFNYNKTAVLCRTKTRTKVISKVLKSAGIPCVTIEQHLFFMRQEVKDALGYLRLIVNPFDTSAMRRMLLRLKQKIGTTTIENITKEGQEYGLQLTDFAVHKTLINGDPFDNLIIAYEQDIVIVFDVETTGLEINKDEIIEIAAVKLVWGEKTGEFHAYIRNTIPVENSELVHKLSDKFLAKEGRNAEEAFIEFFRFIKDGFIVGHNVGFDIKMLTAHANRLGLNIPSFQWGDTWNLSNRFIQAERYSLEFLANQLNLTHLPTHRALDDTHTTVELLDLLIPKIKQHSQQRQKLVSKYGENFKPLAQQVEIWKNDMYKLRPANLLGKILVESQLYHYYEQENDNRTKNLKRLVKIFQDKDDESMNAYVSLRNILEYTALAKNIDQISQDNNQVLVVTIHQSKGLEFDTVFVAGLSQGEFPNYYSIKDGKIEEEKRLFYVAMTRAKKGLYISNYLKDTNGYTKEMSQFIDHIPQKYIEIE
ncbi:MAG: 3'-5' exonuclease [Crocosphaera sp.]